jgi:dephospho-CoA kinase
MITFLRYTFVAGYFLSPKSKFFSTANMALFHAGPIKLGLTGSIGMGKSTVCKQFHMLGFRVFDADAAVHAMYSKNGQAVEKLRGIFPSAIVDGTVDRQMLGKLVLNSPKALQKLEAVIHPIVVDERERFYDSACRDNEFLVRLSGYLPTQNCALFIFC